MQIKLDEGKHRGEESWFEEKHFLCKMDNYIYKL